MSTTISKEATDRFVEVKGVKIHYNEAGQGPTLLCFHGGGPGANAWDNTKHNIEALAARFHVMLVDLPGFGESAKDPKLGDSSLDLYYANLIRDLMDVKGIERAHLYTSSFSGATSLRFGIEFPERVGKIVMQASGGIPPETLFSPYPTEGLKALAAFSEDPTRENMAKVMRLFIPKRELCTEEMIDARYKAAMTPGHLAARREFSAAKNSNVAPLLHKLKAEVLIVWGHHDRMVPFEGLLSGLGRIPNVRVHIWGGGTGHFVEYEKADEFNRLVIDFLTH